MNNLRKLILIFFLTLLGTNVNYAQTIVKSNISSFSSPVTNDSLIISVGQAVTGFSENENILHHGYLPLTRHFLNLNSISSTTLNLYPNPTSNTLVIDSENLKEFSIKIFSSTGVLVYEAIKNTNDIINVSNLSSGVYFVQLNDGSSNLSSLKFIKQ